MRQYSVISHKNKFLTLLLLLTSCSLLAKKNLDYNGNPLTKPGTITITPQTSSAILANYTQAINLDGLLDKTFGTLGLVKQPAGRGLAVAIQSDGKIVTTGFDGAANFRTVRYTTNGSLDTTFNTSGYITQPAGIAYGITLQPDGKIIAAGFDGGFANFCIARYNTNGTLDQSFNATGFTTQPAGGALGVTLQSDGKIIAAGNDGAGNFCVVRYNQDGTLDLSFNATGFNAAVAGSASGVVLQTDGKIVAAGGAAGNFAVVRYNSNGSVDTAFNTNGLTSGPVGTIFAVVIQTDGKIIGIGSGGGGAHFVTARYNTNGTLDQSFGTNGVVTGPAGNPRGGTLQPDGKIIAAGYDNPAVQDICIIRYNIDGTFDQSFGTNGVVITALPAGSYGSGIALQPDNKIVVSGLDGAGNICVARFINSFTLATFNASYGNVGFL